MHTNEHDPQSPLDCRQQRAETRAGRLYIIHAGHSLACNGACRVAEASSRAACCPGDVLRHSSCRTCTPAGCSLHGGTRLCVPPLAVHTPNHSPRHAHKAADPELHHSHAHAAKDPSTSSVLQSCVHVVHTLLPDKLARQPFCMACRLVAGCPPTSSSSLQSGKQTPSKPIECRQYSSRRLQAWPGKPVA